jgi:hypothetical protein
MTALEQANVLLLDVERKRGLPPTKLGIEDQIAFGTLMFKFVPERNVLVVAILISHDALWNKIDDQASTAFLRAKAALSDPAIGGLFDSGGGSWMFERSTGKTFLFREFSLDTSGSSISNAIDEMTAVVPAWQSRWRNAVARIAHGREPPPQQPVTLKNDPYAGQL